MENLTYCLLAETSAFIATKWTATGPRNIWLWLRMTVKTIQKFTASGWLSPALVHSTELETMIATAWPMPTRGKAWQSITRSGSTSLLSKSTVSACKKELVVLYSTYTTNFFFSVAHDFTFASKVRGQIVPYGEAGDCYSTANCPQGQFGIDLSGTGLRVSPYTGWVGQGNRPSLWLKRESVKCYFNEQKYTLLFSVLFCRKIKWFMASVVDIAALVCQNLTMVSNLIFCPHPETNHGCD